MPPHFLFLSMWAISTAAFSLMQYTENRAYGVNGRYWAPVWWIVLTWPYWLVMVGFGTVWRVKKNKRK